MKILIGTPIHRIKDYAMERWLENVANLQKEYPADLIMVDNSLDNTYIEKVKNYCKKYGVINYKLVHVDVGPRSILDERLAKSREIIRQEVLTNDYDAWFSWECDIIIPPDALTKLVGVTKNFWVMGHAYPNRIDPRRSNAELGITLVKRRVLEEFIFLNSYGSPDPLEPNHGYSGDMWFCTWMRRNYPKKYTQVYKIIKPVYHLSE